MFTQYSPRGKKSSKGSLSPASKNHRISSVEEIFEPAIDGPPSPERIRAFTEQMKSNSALSNYSRTNTFSSGTSSFRSRESVSTSLENLSISRKSSIRSNASSMPPRTERPESVQIFGKFFSRGGRKSRKHNNASGNASPPSRAGASIREEISAREHERINGRGSRSGSISSPLAQEPKRHLISGPYNFQHVTHTRQDHLPDLDHTSKVELASEFSAIRASQRPTTGKLRGIKADDLHFENFSCEAFDSPTEDPAHRSPTSSLRRQRSLLHHKSFSPPEPRQRTVAHARSCDNLRSPPPRPTRTSLSPLCPMPLPTRTSSRTASILFDNFDPLSIANRERPRTNGVFRKPAPLFFPSPPPVLAQTWAQPQEHEADELVSHALTTPGDEAWPLTPSSCGTFPVDLPDVQEEEEDNTISFRRSRLSTASEDLRASKSVPELRVGSYDQGLERPNTGASSTLGTTRSNEMPDAEKSPLLPGSQPGHASWEDDIDYCYEHEVEADMDYQWDRCSVEDNVDREATAPTHVIQGTDIHPEDDYRSLYRGPFPQSPFASASNRPELSPVSFASTISSGPATPSGVLRQNFLQSSSRTSSFKELHGFKHSPTLVIPGDFSSQMEQEALYDEHFRNHSTSAAIFAQDPYGHSISPIDESTSSTASYRSSNFSRGSARSSSSTRISGLNTRESQDAVLLISRAANVRQAHRSIGSASSLPDLIRSKMRRSANNSDMDLPAEAATLEGTWEERAYASTGDYAHAEQGSRKGVHRFVPSGVSVSDRAEGSLRTVADPLVYSSQDLDMRVKRRERNVSTPIIHSPVGDFKGRARSSTIAAVGGGAMGGAKRRESYMLFPQM